MIDKHIEATRAALEEARRTEADRYAPDAMQLAERTFSRAMAEVEAQKMQLFPLGSFGQAKGQLEKAKRAALWTVYEARAEREKTRQDANRLIQKVRKILPSLSRERESSRDKSSGSKVEIEVLVNKLAEAKWAYQAGDYLTALNKAEWIHTTVKEIK